MPLAWFKARHFRCLADVELDLDPRANLFLGPNASGKTSLLEAAFYLSRGRSFRTRQRDALIAHGQPEFLLTGESAAPPVRVVLGVQASRSKATWHVGGAPAEGTASLAERFAAQVIDPEIHKLLEEGPSRRRRFLDWGVFHVEPQFLDVWRRYHQALRQRNAALKQDRNDDDLAAWEQELAPAGEMLARQRESYLEQLAVPLAAMGSALLGEAVVLRHLPGWDSEQALAAALRDSRARDRRYRATQVGPHRADVRVEIGGRPAKDRVSRGQQKLVASALMLAQLQIQEREHEGRSALLLDDPAAELDPANLGRLMDVVRSLSTQLWITSLHDDVNGLPPAPRVFHVEHGRIRAR